MAVSAPRRSAVDQFTMFGAPEPVVETKPGKPEPYRPEPPRRAECGCTEYKMSEVWRIETGAPTLWMPLHSLGCPVFVEQARINLAARRRELAEQEQA